MPTNKLRESVNFRLDPKLLKAARKKADKEGISLTALIVQGLNQVLGLDSSIDKSIEFQSQLQELNTRVEKLERKRN